MEEPSHNGIGKPDKDQLMDLAAAKMTALQKSVTVDGGQNGIADGQPPSEPASPPAGNGSSEHKPESEEDVHTVNEKGEGCVQSNGSDAKSSRGASSEEMDSDEEDKLLGKEEEKRESACSSTADDKESAMSVDNEDIGTNNSSPQMTDGLSTSADVSQDSTSHQASKDQTEDMDVDTAEGAEEKEDTAETKDENTDDDKQLSGDEQNNEDSVKDSDSKENDDKQKESDGDERPESKNDSSQETDSNSSKDKDNDTSESETTTDKNKDQGKSKETDSSGSCSENDSKKIVLDDGDELIITVNEESDHEDKEVDVTSTHKPAVTPNAPISSSSSHNKLSTATAPGNKKPSVPQVGSMASKVLVPVSSTGQFYMQQSSSSTSSGYVQPFTVVQQHQGKQQTGYITKVGNQAVFVPMSSSVKPGTNVMVTVNGGQQPSKQVSLSTAPSAPSITEVTPKSSMDMIELMKWELQNKVPDNHSWSVVFHHRKDTELSSLTTFLLELGHDVVKESVYKDIIQIQTKKKELGKLKEGEVESLEKMKSVYEDTRQKVEHLHLKPRQCDRCKFSTESDRALDLHKDYPHYDPPNDSYGEIVCSHCDFRTKQAAAFAFHMEALHQLKAKLPEKTDLFKCELCPIESNSKNKVTKHRFKCSKNFKLHSNLQPYFHDVNYCIKNIYYKPKRPIPKPMPERVRPKAMPIRQPGALPVYQQRPPQNLGPRLAVNVNNPRLVRHGVAVNNPVRSMLQQKTVINQPQRQAVSVMPTMPMLSKQAPTVPTKAIQQNVPRKPDMSGFEVCELCGGYVKDRQALRIHFYYAHKVEMPLAIFNRPTPPLICEVCQSRFWTTQGLSKHKSSLRHYGPAATTVTSPNNQQCFMCLRRVANLFVHVEQVHGMTMKDLVAMKKCIMCGVTAPDRRQLEVHMASQHGVLIKANDFLTPDKGAAPVSAKAQPQPPAAMINKTASGGSSLVRNNLCVFCQVQFPDNIQLTMHCIKNHATCTACGMVVASNKHLQSHNCKKKTKDCMVCGIKRLSYEAYNVHITKHTKACKIKLHRMSDTDIENARKKVKLENKPQVICLDSDEDGNDDKGHLKKIDSEKLKKLEQFKVEPVLSDDDDDDNDTGKNPNTRTKVSNEPTGRKPNTDQDEKCDETDADSAGKKLDSSNASSDQDDSKQGDLLDTPPEENVSETNVEKENSNSDSSGAQNGRKRSASEDDCNDNENVKRAKLDGDQDIDDNSNSNEVKPVESETGEDSRGAD